MAFGGSVTSTTVSPPPVSAAVVLMTASAPNHFSLVTPFAGYRKSADARTWYALFGLVLNLGHDDLDTALLELGPQCHDIVFIEVVLERERLESALFDRPPLLDLVE